MSGHRHRPPEPIPDLALVLIDGDNLLHRVRGMRDEAGVAWLLPRLVAWRPPGVQVTVVLDGVPDPGSPRRQRAASGITWEHSGRLDADTAIVEVAGARPYADRVRTVVVTDDRGLAERARHVGVLTRGVEWLVEQLNRPPIPGPAGTGGRPTVPPGPQRGGPQGGGPRGGPQRGGPRGGPQGDPRRAVGIGARRDRVR